MGKKLRTYGLLLVITIGVSPTSNAYIDASIDASVEATLTAALTALGLGITTGAAGLPAGLAASGVVIVASTVADYVNYRHQQEAEMNVLKNDALEYLAEGKQNNNFYKFVDKVQLSHDGAALTPEQIAAALLILEYQK